MLVVANHGILGLQPRDKAAMLVVKTKEIFLLNLHQNRVHFQAERNAFVLDHQHGLRDVTCKPATLHLNYTSYSDVRDLSHKIQWVISISGGNGEREENEVLHAISMILYLASHTEE